MGFIDRYEHWRKKQGTVDVFEDMYDPNGKRKSRQHSFGLTINIDWFQPFRHTNYSVGTIYMVVMNLPRAERLNHIMSSFAE